ncbi:MAG TPA: DUF1854 domain-containing protein [Planctomycetota bacterium]|nr:DUF1854 domain-containing protein [Planctomycetota bacterium]
MTDGENKAQGEAQPVSPAPAPAAPPEKPAIRWLEPGEVAARWEPEAARLCVRIGSGEELADVRAAMGFPVTAPGEYVELRDAKGEPAGMIRSLESLDAASRAAVRAALEVRYLIPQVGAIEAIDELRPFLIRWRVRTSRGERVFHTESPREAVRYQGADRIRVTDLSGNHYDFPSISKMDDASRERLSAIL